MLQATKLMGLYPCPRCLVLKTDIPEVETFLDMNRRQNTARVYPTQNVEIARKAIFNSGSSISYRGPHDTLKVGSWAPTRVRLFLMLALPPIHRVPIECICNRTQYQPILIAGRR